MNLLLRLKLHISYRMYVLGNIVGSGSVKVKSEAMTRGKGQSVSFSLL